MKKTTVDYLLVFAASCVITVALWPKQGPRQILKLKSTDGQWQLRSLALNDPLLQDIESRIIAAGNLESSPDSAIASWQSELQEFYDANPVEANRPSSVENDVADSTSELTEMEEFAEQALTQEGLTASISDDIVTASYEANSATDGEIDQHTIQMTSLSEVSDVPNDEIKDENSSALIDTNTELKTMIEYNDAAVSTPSAVELKTILPPRKPSMAFHFAFLVGVLAACGYKFWLARTPADEDTSIQTTSVQIRQYSFASGVVLALFSGLLLVL